MMPSWAIPKGPSLDSSVKRLAMMTTDHALSYQHFEGILPEGRYGAGPVIIWDRGYYVPEVEVAASNAASAKGVREQVSDRDQGQKVMKEGMKKGEIKFYLYGKKLKGSFALIKTRGFAGKNAWLLIKHKDEFVKPNYNVSDYPESAVSGKKIEEIK